jgi:hypothetical protein
MKNHNHSLQRAFADFKGPWDLYRSVYKNVDCGPTLTFNFRSEVTGQEEKITNDDLHKWGNWASINFYNIKITDIWVSSIVEGSDAEVGKVYVQVMERNWKQISKDFWQAVEEVNSEACALWEEANAEMEDED